MNILIEKNLMVPMRDGVEMATDVYRPDSEGPVPTLVQRLPYNKELVLLVNYAIDVSRAVQAGYAVVTQDTRGRFASGGEFNPFFDDAEDGADTIAWAADQAWSTGKVGMVGGSYFGATQWLAATQTPEALQAMAPYVTVDDYHEGWAYQGGAFELGFNLSWTLLFLALGELQRRLGAGKATMEDLGAMIQAIDNNDELYWNLPLKNMPPLKGVAPYYFDWLDHPDYDDYWSTIAPKEHYEKIAVPALNIGGWYDLFLGGTLANYRGMKEKGGSDVARANQRLIIGPWAHGVAGGAFSERQYGLMAGTDAFDLTGAQLRWFDRWLKGEDNGVENDKPVQIFVMGANAWREEDDWPLPDTKFTPYYLARRGPGQQCLGERYAHDREAERGARRRLPLRPTQSRSDRRWPDLPAGALRRGQRRAAGPAGGGGARGRALLHDPAVCASHGGDGAGRVGPVRFVVRARHRLHRQARRRFAGWPRRDPDRGDTSGSLPGLPLGALSPGARACLRVAAGPVGDGQCIRGRASDPAGGIEQQLPALRPEYQHGWEHRRGGGRRSGPGREPDLPRRRAPVAPGAANHRALMTMRNSL